MTQTLVEKIIARASGVDRVTPGQIVTCKVDLAMFHDSSGPRRVSPRLKALGVGVWDPSKVVVVSDHYVPAVDLESAEILKITRDWVREQGIENFHDMQGICHVMLAEGGHLAPGMFCCGGDSHSTMAGAFGCYMAGFGATEMTGVMVTGEIWTRVPETFLVRWNGTLPRGVVAKDIMLFLCRELGMENNFKVIEYGGPAVERMPMAERVVLTNMAAELGAETGVIAPDAETLAVIRAAGGQAPDDAVKTWRSDPDAAYERVFDFDASVLQPQVARPHTPANSGAVAEADSRRIDQAYIGACVGAKLSDLHMAAEVLKGRKVAKGVRLLVAPASVATTRQAVVDGTMQILTEAGAILLPTGCGACAGYGAGVLARGEVCISTTNRNFKGRMGHTEAEVYLGSPFTVAASAVEGRIADPRPFWIEAAMASLISGKAWTFGDGVDTDVLAPGVYMKLPIAQIATHCLESVDPAFAPNVAPGDVVVGGVNFGLGSSREQAAEALKVLGVGAVLAKSFARIFYRNALNLGLPVLFFAEADEIAAGDRLEIELVEGVVRNLTSGKTYRIEPIPGHLMQMIDDGGLMPHLEKRLKAKAEA